jgi:UDP-N-acetylglucosamine 1-carboxyvinyltransferase
MESSIGTCRSSVIAASNVLPSRGDTSRLLRREETALFTIPPSRSSSSEAGSYACAAAITGGSLELLGARRETMPGILSGLTDAGMIVEDTRDGIRVTADRGLKPLSLSTAPYPAFPTDMQAQFMAMLTLAEGTSLLTETIFENRYMHVPELNRMGADIEVRGRSAVVRGVKALHGAPVMATDLRASMSLVLAGLAAAGETQVHRVYHLDRGYERLEEKLQAVGADIERASDG